MRSLGGLTALALVVGAGTLVLHQRNHRFVLSAAEQRSLHDALNDPNLGNAPDFDTRNARGLAAEDKASRSAQKDQGGAAQEQNRRRIADIRSTWQALDPAQWRSCSVEMPLDPGEKVRGYSQYIDANGDSWKIGEITPAPYQNPWPVKMLCANNSWIDFSIDEDGTNFAENGESKIQLLSITPDGRELVIQTQKKTAVNGFGKFGKYSRYRVADLRPKNDERKVGSAWLEASLLDGGMRRAIDEGRPLMINMEGKRESDPELVALGLTVLSDAGLLKDYPQFSDRGLPVKIASWVRGHLPKGPNPSRFDLRAASIDIWPGQGDEPSDEVRIGLQEIHSR